MRDFENDFFSFNEVFSFHGKNDFFAIRKIVTEFDELEFENRSLISVMDHCSVIQ